MPPKLVFSKILSVFAWNTRALYSFLNDEKLISNSKKNIVKRFKRRRSKSKSTSNSSSNSSSNSNRSATKVSKRQRKQLRKLQSIIYATTNQTENKSSGVFIEKKQQNTCILSDDYVITLPMTQCGEIWWSIESNSSTPLLVRNRFKSSKPVDQMDLSPGAIQILNLPNAGGNSLESEVLSFELLHRW